MNRYKNTKIEANKYYQTTDIPIIEEKESDIYIIVKEGDRLDLLA
jgi:hypothetical protein